MQTGLGGLHRIVLVMNGRCRARQVVDLIHFDIEREGHIVAHQLEVRVIEQMGDVVLDAGEEIVKADDVVTVVQQALAEMRAEEAGAAGDERARAGAVIFHFNKESLKKTVFMHLAYST